MLIYGIYIGIVRSDASCISPVAVGSLAGNCNFPVDWMRMYLKVIIVAHVFCHLKNELHMYSLQYCPTTPFCQWR